MKATGSLWWLIGAGAVTVLACSESSDLKRTSAIAGMSGKSGDFGEAAGTAGASGSTQLEPGGLGGMAGSDNGAAAEGGSEPAHGGRSSDGMARRA
jgi:hypothetical protein